MREIRFRYRLKDRDGKIETVCAPLHSESNGTMQFPINLKYWEVLSIDEYTGLHDKNGQEIYEGDIVQLHTYDDEEIQTGTAEIYWNSIDIEFQLKAIIINNEYATSQWAGWASDLWEVIGNIYDNPELMEGKHGEIQL